MTVRRCCVVLYLIFAASRLTAQDTERPVTFDQAGRLTALSPSMVSRLGLKPPLWPVVGDFVDARIYARSGGDFVVAVTKANGAIDRYPITAQAKRDLADALAQAMVTTGLASSAERFDVISEPAGNRFIVNQVIAGLVIYAPLVASLGEGDGAGLAYLLTAGGTFFAATAIAQSGTITKAQNALATDGIWRGAILANGIRYAFAGDDDDPNSSDDYDRMTSVVTLSGALVGTVLGFNIARNLTDAEAAASATGSTITAATTAGILGATGAFDCDECRVSSAVLVGSALAGYPLGLRYVRRAPYRVTAGDMSAILTTGMVGALSSAVLIPDSDGNHDRLISSILTGGFATGILAGDRLIAKRHDLTESQASLVRIGAFAGALIGFAIPVAFDIDNGRAVLGFGSGGAMLGVAATLGMVTRR